MPAVGDLDRVRGAAARPVRIGPRPVADHHRDARTLAQPGGQGVGTAVGQQVHDLTPLEVAQDRAVAPPAAPRPVVHAEHSGCHGRRADGGAPSDQPEQRVAADRRAEAAGQPRASLAAERQAEMTLKLA